MHTYSGLQRITQTYVSFTNKDLKWTFDILQCKWHVFFFLFGKFTGCLKHFLPAHRTHLDEDPLYGHHRKPRLHLQKWLVLGRKGCNCEIQWALQRHLVRIHFYKTIVADCFLSLISDVELTSGKWCCTISKYHSAFSKEQFAHSQCLPLVMSFSCSRQTHNKDIWHKYIPLIISL